MKIEIRNGSVSFFPEDRPDPGSDLDLGHVLHLHVGHHQKITAIELDIGADKRHFFNKNFDFVLQVLVKPK